MTTPKPTTLATALLALGLISASGSAQAGPCSDDLAELRKTLSQSSAMGPAVTGALAGSGPGSPVTQGPNTVRNPDATTGVDSGRKSGDGATRDLNATVGQTATSAQDVRAQQEGKPTAAQTADNTASSERLSMAKAKFEQATQLDQQNDQGCRSAVGELRRMVSGQP